MEYREPALLERVLENKRLGLYLLSFVLVVAVQTILYWWGMAILEGEPRSFQESFGVIVQSLTTTGYGQDAPWTSTGMQALIVVAQFTGVAYLFVAFPLFIGPWIRNELAGTRVPDGIAAAEDHVVLAGYSPLCQSLVDDLEARDPTYVIVESDEDDAEALYEDDRHVVYGDISDEETLEKIGLEDATAVVMGARHQDDVIRTLLSLREYDADLEIVPLIEDPEQSRYLRYAGATTVLSPKHRLGKSLADKAQNVVSTEVEDLEELDVDVEISEFPVTEGSPLHGKRLTALEELDRTGATLVGAWLRGEFVTAPSPNDYVDESTVLVVAGTQSQLERVASLTGSGGRSPTAGPVIVVEHGIVGTTAEGILRKTDQETTVIDADPGDGVDVVGDATNGPVLDEAGIEEAETIILALPDDEDALLATLVAREEDADVEIIVAANRTDSVSELYRAGADYVLALPNVAGRMTTLELFDDDVMTLREQIQITRTDAPALEGIHPESDEIRETTDAVIIGVQRNGDVVTHFDDEYQVRSSDDVLVAGTDRGVSNFETEFDE